MKREYIPKYPKVKMTKPFLWKRCLLCNNECRKEKMYKIKDICFCLSGDMVDAYYICNECASSEKDAIKKYKLSCKHY